MIKKMQLVCAIVLAAGSTAIAQQSMLKAAIPEPGIAMQITSVSMSAGAQVKRTTSLPARKNSPRGRPT